MAPFSFLSFRVSTTIRNRLKAIAASRGETMQTLLRRIVEDFLDAPDLHQNGQIIFSAPEPWARDLAKDLLRQQSMLREKGILHLWCRPGVHRPEILVAFSPRQAPSVAGFFKLKEELSVMVGQPLDLVDEATLRAAPRAAALKEASRLF
jgi:hypothetical protein